MCENAFFMKMKLVTAEDLPELLELQRKAYAHDFAGRDWHDDSPLEETLEHLAEEFRRCTIYKVQNAEGEIIGSIRGSVSHGSLWMGRLMVHPHYQGQGIAKFMIAQMQQSVPHVREWFWVCLQVTRLYNFYLRQGFRPTRILNENPNLTWIYMEKTNSLTAFCGLDCQRCDAYIATCDNDNALREATARLWSELNGVPILPEHIHCQGCRTRGAKTYFCQNLCQIRRCATGRGVETCGACKEMAHCQMLAEITRNRPDALENLIEIQKQQPS